LVGFSLPVQEHLLQLCSETASVRTIAVFKDSKWRHADQSMLLSLLFSLIVSFDDSCAVFLAVILDLDRELQPREGSHWFLSGLYWGATNMHGSGQQHLAWIFRRMPRLDHAQ